VQPVQPQLKLSPTDALEETMKIHRLLILLVFASLALSTGFAKSKAGVRDVTGCLSKGDSAKEFLLKGNDGSSWELQSSKVDLAEHVGHTVTVTGVVQNAKMHNMKEDAKDAAKDMGMKKDNSEEGHLTVTDLKMVSESCQ
jgi:hypothetical protein